MHQRVADFARAACYVATLTVALGLVPYSVLLAKLNDPDIVSWRWFGISLSLSAVVCAILIVVKLGPFPDPDFPHFLPPEVPPHTLHLRVGMGLVVAGSISGAIFYHDTHNFLSTEVRAEMRRMLILVPIYLVELTFLCPGICTLLNDRGAECSRPPDDGFYLNRASVLAWRLASFANGAYRFLTLVLINRRFDSKLKSGYWILLPTTANGVAAVLHRAVRCVVTPGPNSPDFPVSSLQYRFAHLVFAILREVQIFAALFAVVTYAEGGCTGFSILTLGVVFPFTFVAPYMICLYCILIPAARGIAPVKEPLIEDLLWLPHWLLLVDMQNTAASAPAFAPCAKAVLSSATESDSNTAPLLCPPAYQPPLLVLQPTTTPALLNIAFFVPEHQDEPLPQLFETV